MPDIQLYEIAVPKKGEAGGVASLDSEAKVPISQLPTGIVETYKGNYATSSALLSAHPTALLADYAYVTQTNSFWYWNTASAIATWVNQEISESAYNALGAPAKASVPYIVGV